MDKKTSKILVFIYKHPGVKFFVVNNAHGDSTESVSYLEKQGLITYHTLSNDGQDSSAKPHRLYSITDLYCTIQGNFIAETCNANRWKEIRNWASFCISILAFLISLS